MHSISREDLAYTAGLIDGEGTITMLKTESPFRHPTVTVASCTHELLQFLKDRFGGNISAKRSYQEGHSPSWTWSAVNDRAMRFLEVVAPFLKEPEKRRRAGLLLTEYKSLTLRNGKYTEEQRQAKFQFETRFFSTQRECQRRRTVLGGSGGIETPS